MSDSSSQPYSAPYFIKYNPALVAEFGSQNAVLLFDRLEYWFSKTKNEFYKFIEPCDHPCYREGDSWCEELGFSRPVFRTAFDKIGMRYISKTAFEKESNPFKGKLFAYYQDRKSNKTIFVRNNSLLAELYVRLKDIIQKTVKAIKPTVEKTLKTFQPRAGGFIQPYVRATKDKQIITPFQKEEDCFPKEVGAGQISDQQSKIALEMKAIWEEEIGSRGLVTLTPDFSQRMHRAYGGLFQGSMDNWRAYCLKIASSKFLMGEKAGTNYQLRLPVALTEKFKIQLEEGRYELNTRKTSHDLKIQTLEVKIQKVSLNKDMIEQQLSHLGVEVKASEKRLISAKIRDLSLEELEGYRTQYETLMRKSSSGEAHSFHQEGWEGRNVKFMFELFLQKKIKEALPEKDIVFSPLVKQEEKLKEKKEQMQELYNLGIQALKELRGNCKILPRGLIDKFDLIKVSAI